MKAKFTKPMLGFILMVLFALVSKAQDKDPQITIKITKEIAGEKKTYEGSYESEEQMNADENLQEFMGEDQQMNKWFSDDEAPHVFHFEPATNGNGFRFDFDDDSLHTVIFNGLSNDSIIGELQLKMHEIAEDFDQEEMQKHLEKMHVQFGKMNLSFNNLYQLDMDSVQEELQLNIQKLHSNMNGKNLRIVISKQLEITKDVEEFGKKGEVTEKNKLELDELGYFPNPSPNGRFTLRLKSSDKGNLNLKVFSLAGTEVYSRTIEGFTGTYSETIDLSGQSEGVYLLEINMGKKRLTRKVVVN